MGGGSPAVPEPGSPSFQAQEVVKRVWFCHVPTQGDGRPGPYRQRSREDELAGLDHGGKSMASGAAHHLRTGILERNTERSWWERKSPSHPFPIALTPAFHSHHNQCFIKHLPHAPHQAEISFDPPPTHDNSVKWVRPVTPITDMSKPQEVW